MKRVFGNKKGEGEEGGSGIPPVVWLILLALSLVLFVPFIYEQVVFGNQLSESSICYTSIIGLPLSSAESRAKCPIREITIMSDSVQELKDDKTKKLDIVNGFRANDEQVNELFAKLMGQCLQSGGGLNSKAFARQWTYGIVCLECANVRFDKDIPKSSFTGLREYLEQNKVQGKDKKYSELFTKDESNRQDWVDFGIENELIPGKNGYSMQKDNTYTVFFAGLKEGTASALFSGRIFAREDTYFVYVAQNDKYTQVCKRIVN